MWELRYDLAGDQMAELFWREADAEKARQWVVDNIDGSAQVVEKTMGAFRTYNDWAESWGV